MIEKMRVSEPEKFTWLAMAFLGLLLGIWLVWPDTGLVRMVPYQAAAQQPNYRAQIDLSLENQWHSNQIAFAENIRQGPDAEAKELHWETGLGVVTPYVAAIGPHTQIHVSNTSVTSQVLSWLAWSNTHRTPVAEKVQLQPGQTLTLRVPEALSRLGQLWALQVADSPAPMAMGVYLPHDYYVLGSEGRKSFLLPNQSVRWRWLRYRPSTALPLQWEVLSTRHTILINEGKPVQLSFETPLRQKP